jgi:hypothetical protein
VASCPFEYNSRMVILLTAGWLLIFLQVTRNLYRRRRVSHVAGAIILSVDWSKWRRVRDAYDGFLATFVLGLLTFWVARNQMEGQKAIGVMAAIGGVTLLLGSLYVYRILKWPYFMAFHKHGVVTGGGTSLVHWCDILTWQWYDSPSGLLIIRPVNGRAIVCRIPQRLRERVANVLDVHVNSHPKNAAITTEATVP